jgi:hypothetical protein
MPNQLTSKSLPFLVGALFLGACVDPHDSESGQTVKDYGDDDSCESCDPEPDPCDPCDPCDDSCDPCPPNGCEVDNGFSGRATVVRAQIANLSPVVLIDTGDLPSSGGNLHQELLNGSVANVLTLQLLSATTQGAGNQASSDASAANLDVNVAGSLIGGVLGGVLGLLDLNPLTASADVLSAHSEATCDASANASVSGSSTIVGLNILGNNIVITGQPNQVVLNLLGITITANEQTVTPDNGSHYASIDVCALHIDVPGLLDVCVARAYSDISCDTSCL